MKRCIIFLGGSRMLPDLSEEDIVICADSGLRPVLGSGLAPRCVIGDMDSLTESEIEAASKRGSRIIRFPPDKDKTDGELALDLCLSFKPDSIVIVGSYTGRTDHILTTFLLLRMVPSEIGCELLIGNGESVRLLRQGQKVSFGSERRIVSLVPFGSDCRVTTRGLRWELKDDILLNGSTRGVHNEPVQDSFSVEVHDGEVFLIISSMDRS